MPGGHVTYFWPEMSAEGPCKAFCPCWEWESHRKKWHLFKLWVLSCLDAVSKTIILLLAWKWHCSGYHSLSMLCNVWDIVWKTSKAEGHLTAEAESPEGLFTHKSGAQTRRTLRWGLPAIEPTRGLFMWLLPHRMVAAGLSDSLHNSSGLQVRVHQHTRQTQHGSFWPSLRGCAPSLLLHSIS